MARKNCSARAQSSSTVRFSLKNGWEGRVNKTGFRSPVKKKLFEYYVKCYEQMYRGQIEKLPKAKTGGEPSPDSNRGEIENVMRKALEKFAMFRDVAGLFPPLTSLPPGFEDMEKTEILATVKKLAMDQLDDAERIYSQFQGDEVQADDAYDMQMVEDIIPDPGSESLARTNCSENDGSLLNVQPRSARSEGSHGVYPGFPLDVGSYSLNQLDNPEGRPPPSSLQYPAELNLLLRDIQLRASRFPDTLPEFEWLKNLLILFERMLKDREMKESLGLESRSNRSRGSLADIPSRLPDSLPDEGPLEQLSDAYTAGIGLQASCYPASDFSVADFETPVPDDKDGHLRNRSISEALEGVPRLTGRLKTNIGDIRPQVYGCSEGYLPGKPVSDNTSQSVGIESFVSAEPPADKHEQWAERWLREFDMPAQESASCHHLLASPVRDGSFDSSPHALSNR